MAGQIGVITVPTRFEALRDAVGSQQLTHVLIEAPSDLVAIKEALVEVKASGQGKLMFLLGSTGVGKTTLAASSQLYLSNLISGIVTPPPDYEVSLGDLPAWLAKNMPILDRQGGITIVNLDGRELPALDINARQAAMVNLNAYLRRMKDILAVWPVINRSFAEELVQLLDQVGGGSALVHRRIHEVQGIERVRYFDALQLILNATGTRLEDAAITRQEAEDIVDKASTIGDYLGRIRDLVVSRYDIGDLGAKLPRLYIIVTSNGDSADACRMLRRGSKYLADPERLLQFSRANVADDWRRNAQRNARHGLPFIASLFELRLLNLTGSMIVNACAFSEEKILRETVRKHYPNPVKANAANTIAKSSVVRALKNEEDVSPSGSTSSPEVSAAYAAIQRLSVMSQ